jgi:uncharacterized membrane protein YbhN (UPF0104 family)
VGHYSAALPIKALVTGGIIYLILGRVELHLAPEIVLNIQVPFLVAAVVLLLPMGFTAALRWVSVTAAYGEKLTFGRALFYCWIGQFLNLGLPIVGFDGTRVWKLHQHGLRWDHAAQIVISDRLCALTSLVLVIALGMPRIVAVSGGGWFPSVAIMAFLAGVLALAFLVFCRNFAPFISSIPLLKPLLAFSEKLNGTARRAATGRALFWGACNHLIRVVIVILLAFSLGINLQVYDAFAFVPVALLIAMLPITLGGWGIREAVFISAFGLIGITATQALALSVLFGLTILLMGLIGGVIWIFEQSRPGFQAASNAVTKPL